jgi:restriction system protein
MAKRRGFFEELAHQQKHASQLAQQQARFRATLAQQAADLERWQREAEQRRAASDARMAEILAQATKRTADFDASNVAAAERLSEIDRLLQNALARTPFRIEQLAKPALHPPFDGGDLARPLEKPALVAAPPEPIYQPPPQPQGLAKIFNKRQFAEAEQAARAKWQQDHAAWATYVEQTLPAHNQHVAEQYEAGERDRRQRLDAAHATYKRECEAREEAAKADREHVEKVKVGVANNEPDAVVELIGAIFENSPYPAGFSGSFEVDYDAESREATITLYVPDPGSMPTVKAYKRLVTTGEVREVLCTQAEQRHRYNTAVAAAAVRAFHELFTAVPAGVVETASVAVGTETVDPATGQVKLFRFVEAAAAREDLLQYNLSQVEPVQTLVHMGAVVSKNAFGLKPISDVRGIRK